MHFQEVEHFAGEGAVATGFKHFEAMLKKFPKTQFIGHADAFWANVDANYANEASYPTGPITRGGITDKLLGDYANLFGDLSAEFRQQRDVARPGVHADFLQRHQDKLIFGSDCSCADGKGGGTAQANNPAAARTGRQVRGTGDADAAARIHLTRGVPQDHVGQRPHRIQAIRSLKSEG